MKAAARLGLLARLVLFWRMWRATAALARPEDAGKPTPAFMRAWVESNGWEPGRVCAFYERAISDLRTERDTYADRARHVEGAARDQYARGWRSGHMYALRRAGDAKGQTVPEAVLEGPHAERFEEWIRPPWESSARDAEEQANEVRRVPIAELN